MAVALKTKKKGLRALVGSFCEEFAGGSELTRMLTYDDEGCRQRLMGDLVNTGVVATLLTGFAYETWVVINAPPTTILQISKDILTFATIQASMLSAISATVLFKKVSAMDGRHAKQLLRQHRAYFMAPHASFCLGTITFLGMVLLFGVMSTGRFWLKLLYVGMSLLCPLILGFFYTMVSSIHLRDDDPENQGPSADLVVNTAKKERKYSVAPPLSAAKSGKWVVHGGDDDDASTSTEVAPA